MKVEVSEEIERPVPVVFKFFAEDHVRNHPRWDPDIELWLTRGRRWASARPLLEA